MQPDPATIFKGVAWYYARYRRPYPEKVFQDIISYFKLDGNGKLLDLGCGTGEITIPLSRHFESVIGVDPNSEMLEEAARKTTDARITNISWIADKAENINPPEGSLRLVTAGVSFHWMDREKVFANMYRALEDSGGMVVIGDTSPVRGQSKTEDWRVKRKEIIKKYFGDERRAGDHLHKDFIPSKIRFEEYIAEHPFKSCEVKEYAYTTERNMDEIIGFLYSTSYANRRLLGDQAERFENELREELLKLVPSGVFVEPGKVKVALFRK